MGSRTDDISDIVIIGGIVYILSKIPSVAKTVSEIGAKISDIGESHGETLGKIISKIQEQNYKAEFRFQNLFSGGSWSNFSDLFTGSWDNFSGLFTRNPPEQSGGGGSTGAG